MSPQNLTMISIFRGRRKKKKRGKSSPVPIFPIRREKKGFREMGKKGRKKIGLTKRKEGRYGNHGQFEEKKGKGRGKTVDDTLYESRGKRKGRE